jgi:hypothetical protein
MVPNTKADDTGRTRNDYDTLCASLVRDSFYAIYTIGNSLSQPLANYSIYDGCSYALVSLSLSLSLSCCPHFIYRSSTIQTDCPTPEQQYYCPCITLKTNDLCDTLSCDSAFSSSQHICSAFRASTIAGCYCMNQLVDTLPLLSPSYLPSFLVMN